MAFLLVMRRKETYKIKQSETIPNDKLYVTWEEIASRLQINSKTAMKYARIYGLPVKKFPPGKVRIYESELKKWLETQTREVDLGIYRIP